MLCSVSDQRTDRNEILTRSLLNNLKLALWRAAKVATRTFSEIFWHISISWSPSSITSGSTIGTNPACWLFYFKIVPAHKAITVYDIIYLGKSYAAYFKLEVFLIAAYRPEISAHWLMARSVGVKPPCWIFKGHRH